MRFLNLPRCPRDTLSKVDEGLQTLENIFTSIAAASVFLMAVLITLDVTGRYAFSNPIQGVHAVVESYLMPITVYFSVSYVERNDQHIRVTLVYDRLKTVHKRILEVVFRVVMIFILLFLIRVSTIEAIGYIREGQAIYGINIPFGYSWVLIPLGFSFLAVRLALDGAKLLLSEKEVSQDSDH